MTAFLKMHGLGNDFVVFDARKVPLALGSDSARAVADRRLGIGCDQVIVIGRSSEADATMRIFNADGSEVEACGNAARCVARLLMEERDGASVRIATQGGMLEAHDAGHGAVTIDMGKPCLNWHEIPLAEETDTREFALRIDGVTHSAAAVSVGNPHCVLFVDDAGRAPVAELGSRIETCALFPERVNVEFVQVETRNRLRMRVWERGVGITRACGTGACASAVAAARRGLADRDVDVVLDGGMLHILWRESDAHILMTGPCALSFAGHVDLAALERAS
jgi:diaminopimelate epimerase